MGFHQHHEWRHELPREAPQRSTQAPVGRPGEVSPTAHGALSAGHPVLVERVSAPQTPRLPPTIRFEQMRPLSHTLLTNDPAATEILVQATTGKAAVFVAR